MIKTFNCNNRPPKKDFLEYNNGTTLTETSGYLSKQKRVESILLAGERLMDYRREMYDYAPDDPETNEEIVVVRNPNFDMADASELHNDAVENLRRQDAIAKSKQKAILAKKQLDLESASKKKPKNDTDGVNGTD